MLTTRNDSQVTAAANALSGRAAASIAATVTMARPILTRVPIQPPSPASAASGAGQHTDAKGACNWKSICPGNCIIRLHYAKVTSNPTCRSAGASTRPSTSIRPSTIPTGAARTRTWRFLRSLRRESHDRGPARGEGSDRRPPAHRDGGARRHPTAHALKRTARIARMVRRRPKRAGRAHGGPTEGSEPPKDPPLTLRTKRGYGSVGISQHPPVALGVLSSDRGAGTCV
jgi:hypothetical protein